MRKLWIFAVLAGCAVEPTVADAVHEVAVATCHRGIRCGTFLEGRFDLCVRGIERELCGPGSGLDCSAPYSDRGSFEELLECTSWYDGLGCSAPAHICTL